MRHKILKDFEIQTDPLIPGRKLDPSIIFKKRKEKKRKKRTCCIVDLAVPVVYRMKKSTKRENYLDLARSLRKLLNIRVTVISIVFGALGMVPRGFRNWETNKDNPNYNIVDIGQNTELSPGDLRRLAATQAPVSY